MENPFLRGLLFTALVAGLFFGGFTHNLFMLIVFTAIFITWGTYLIVTIVLDDDKTAMREYEKFRKVCGYDSDEYDFACYISELSNRRLLNLYHGLGVARKHSIEEHGSGIDEKQEQKQNAELDNLMRRTREEIIYRVDRNYY